MSSAHDVRHLTTCWYCRHLGDRRTMLRVGEGHWHDACAVQQLGAQGILALPASERDKVTLGAAGVPLMLELLRVAVEGT